MTIAQMNVYLATPNEDGKKVDFSSPSILKQVLEYIKRFNVEQPNKELKISAVSANQLTLYLKADASQVSLQGNGRDIIALSNIFRDEGWYKFSTSEKLLTVDSYKTLEDFEENYEQADILPKAYSYIYMEDFSKVLPDDDAVELLKSLIILTKNEFMGSKVSRQNYQNALYKIKEQLFYVFH